MTDLEFTIRAICARRGVTLSKIESVAANFKIAFGLANLTALLPVVANTFYYVAELNGIISSALTGAPQLRLTNNGGASNGDLDIVVQPYFGGATAGVIFSQLKRIETDSMLYIVNNHSAGTFVLTGTVFKITYA